MVAIVVALVAWPRGSSMDLAETIISGSEESEIADAIRELVRDPDPAALERIAQAAESSSVVVDRLRSITEGLIERFDPASAAAGIRILGGLAVIDDPVAAPTFVAAVLSGDPELQAEAALLMPGLSRSLPAAIDLLVVERATLSGAAAKTLDALLVVLGPAAVDAVAAVAQEQPWALDFLIMLGEPAIEPLVAISTTGGLSDQATVVSALLKLDESYPEVVGEVWPAVMERLSGFVSANPTRVTQLGDILRKIERTRDDLARPVQKKLVNAMLPKLASQDFAVPEAIAHIGRAAVPKLIAIARSGGMFASQDVAHKADFARLSLISMIRVAPQALKPLMDGLRDKDYELIADVMLFYVQLGKRGSEPILIEALNRHGDTMMALEFLQSGNRKLEQGARNWASANGYTITGSYSGPGSWGMG